MVTSVSQDPMGPAMRSIANKASAVGTIVKVGEHVNGFNVGDRVGFMMFKDFCGMNIPESSVIRY